MRDPVIVITPPEPIMTAAQAKAGMPSLAGVDDDLVDGLIAAATAELDGPNGELGRAIGPQTLELQLDRFPPGNGFIQLRCPPIVDDVIEVVYDDVNDTESTFDPAQYRLRGSILRLKSGFSWPSACGGPGAVRIRYQAGYDEVPQPILTAVQLRVGDLYYAQRVPTGLKKEVVEGIGSKEWVVGTDGKTATDKAITRLLSTYVIPSV